MKKLLLITICIIILLSLTLTIVACDGDSFTVSYLSNGNGSIEGISIQKIQEGDSSKKVVAIADEGYQFIGWSDGNTNKERIDKEIKSDLTIYAMFEKMEYEVKYQAYGGGSIKGKTEQIIKYGENAEPVTAVPDFGYKFKGWKDGLTSATRQDFGIESNVTFDAVFVVEIVYEIKFTAGEGGIISGEAIQKIEEGKDSSYVTAIANENYEFVKWSDEVKNETRNIVDVQKDIELTAIFRRIKEKFIYDYNGATKSANIDSIEISYSDLEYNNLEFEKPEKDGYTFAGWYLEWHLTTIVSDAQGNLLIGKELFERSTGKLYAKWVALEAPHYKILMVNVTNVKADFQTYDGRIIHVDFQQSEAERLIHQQTAKLFANYLNSILNGAVIFDIITFDTTLPLNSSNFNKSYSANFIEYFTMADKIPELQYIIGDFDSTITTLNMHDYNSELHHGGGCAYGKNACVFAESILGPYIQSGNSFEKALDSHRSDYEIGWQNHIEFYIHEFIHTIEFQNSDLFDYHEAIRIYSEQIQGISSELDVAKLYLTNTLPINGTLEGIPFICWQKTNQN